jgi:hypothetical protein
LFPELRRLFASEDIKLIVIDAAAAFAAASPEASDVARQLRQRPFVVWILPEWIVFWFFVLHSGSDSRTFHPVFALVVWRFAPVACLLAAVVWRIVVELFALPLRPLQSGHGWIHEFASFGLFELP